MSQSTAFTGFCLCNVFVANVASVNANLDKQLAIGHNAADLQNIVLGMLTVCLSGNPFR